MKLLLHDASEAGPEGWCEALHAVLPDADILAWQPGVASDCEVALVWNPPQRLFDEQPQLRLAFNLGAGVDALLALRLPPQLAVVRLQDAGMAVQMAEYVCHALIRWFREFERYEAQQPLGQWLRHPLRVRAEFGVGILGLGAIGERVARAVQAFDYPLRGWSRTPRALAGVQCFAGAAALDEFLAATRVLVCLLPLTPETRGLLDRERLLRLPRGSYLINLARGALVVEDDLRALLDEGHLAGAALDVMAREPLPADHWLWTHPRVRLTPHISGMTQRHAAAVQVAQALQAYARGAPLPGRVDLARGY